VHRLLTIHRRLSTVCAQTATDCNRLQQTATLCNTLQHTVDNLQTVVNSLCTDCNNPVKSIDCACANIPQSQTSLNSHSLCMFEHPYHIHRHVGCCTCGTDCGHPQTVHVQTFGTSRDNHRKERHIYVSRRRSSVHRTSTPYTQKVNNIYMLLTLCAQMCETGSVHTRSTT